MFVRVQIAELWRYPVKSLLGERRLNPQCDQSKPKTGGRMTTTAAAQRAKTGR